MPKNPVVYSTDANWRPQDESKEQATPSKQGTVYVQRVTKGRAGKTVTLVKGLMGNLKQWKKDLQQHCGAGGTVKGDVIEIQGDHRQKIADLLQKREIKVKFSGG